jgi:hypothetical protein
MMKDGDEEGMADFVREKYVETGLAIHVQMRRKKEHRGPMRSYNYISDHYRFALGQAFDVLKFDTALILGIVATKKERISCFSIESRG